MAGMGDMMGDMMGGADDPDSDDVGEHGYSDEETKEIMDFMDDSLPQDARASALQEAIRLCVEKHVKPEAMSSGMGMGSEEKKPAGGLALIFGPKKKG